MRLAFISPSFYPAFYYGGPIFSSYNTAKEIAKLGIPVYVTTTNINGKEKLDVDTNRFLQIEDKLFIKYHPMATSNGFSPFMLWGLWKDISSADIVYTQSVFSSSSVLVLFYSSLLKKPVLFSPRGQLGEWCLKAGSSFKKLWLNFFIRPFAYKVNWHVTAEQEKHELEAVFPGSKKFLIPNGIDLKEYEGVSQSKDKKFYLKYAALINEKSSVVVSMGRLHSKKGFDILIDAFARFNEVKPDSFLFIAGEDYGEKNNLNEKIVACGVQDRARLVGQINDKKEKVDFLCNADMFALPSHNENFGIVYAEALAAGTPVVASLNTPWKEVEESQCGRWVNNTVDEFFKAMTELSSMESKTLSSNAKKLAAKYNWQNIALSFNEALNNILDKSNDIKV